MHVEYSIVFTPRDHHRASRLQLGYKGWVLFALSCGFFFWLLAVRVSEDGTVIPPDEAAVASVLITLIGWTLLCVMDGVALLLMSWSWARRARREDCRVDVVLDEDGLSQTNSRWTTWDSWGLYKSFRENRHLFFVQRRDGLGYMIPKRVLTPEQIDEVRERLGQLFA